MGSRFYCGDYERSWARKEEWKNHFSSVFVKEESGQGGKDVRNPCLNRKRKILGKTLEEARSAKNAKTMTSIFTSSANALPTSSHSTCCPTSKRSARQLQIQIWRALLHQNVVSWRNFKHSVPGQEKKVGLLIAIIT